MADSLLDRAERALDDGVPDGPFAPDLVDGRLHEVADDLAVVCSMSHVWTLRTDEGLTVFDTSLAELGPDAVASVRSWADEPINSIVFTHGHIDHVGGAPAFLADSAARGHARPRIVAHENVPPRFDRYLQTRGYNMTINSRQAGGLEVPTPTEFEQPDELFREELSWSSGDLTITLLHDRGETDDHAWAWIPERRAILSGDLFFRVFPNAGNPQKVQRYAAEWVAALRRMIRLQPELLLPAHGLPIAGCDRIATVLGNVADALEHLVTETVSLMNAGATLDEIVRTVRVPDTYEGLPYLQETYDEPEFIVRNIWRLSGGWYDGNPARLKPAPDAALAAEVCSLAGGAGVLAQRAFDLSGVGDHRLACQLVEWAVQSKSDDASLHAIRAEVYRTRRDHETSIMAKGIYGTAAASSDGHAGTRDDPLHTDEPGEGDN